MYLYFGFFKTKERKRKVKLYIKGSKFIEEHLDIRFLLKNLLELEKLKTIILTP